jgi:hypothetical protein
MQLVLLIGRFLKQSSSLKPLGQIAITFHMCFLPNFGSFVYSVSEENFFLEINQSAIRIACGGHVC